MTDQVLSIDAIRAAFPALTRRHRGQSVGYFDGPGGTQVPNQVIDAMADYLRHHNANTHWNYPSSQETDGLILDARQTVADLLKCRAGEVVFGANMTTLTFHLARGLARRWDEGDEIIVTDLDHHGNVGPWEAVARDRGLVLQRIPFDPHTGQLDLELLIGSIDRKTRLVAVGWASNALGTVTDVARVCAAARAKGVLSFVDAVHAVPHILPDVEALGTDFLACSPYKFYGPHQGVLFGREPLLADVDVPKLRPAPDASPERLETGTLSHEAIMGTKAAIEFIASIAPRQDRRRSLEASYAIQHQRAARQVEKLWDGLGSMPGVRLFGPTPDRPRTSTVSFVVHGVKSSDVATRLAERGLFLSHGDFYAATVIERLGVGPEGVVRAGAACYTSDEEIDRLIAGVAEIAGK